MDAWNVEAFGSPEILQLIHFKKQFTHTGLEKNWSLVNMVDGERSYEFNNFKERMIQRELLKILLYHRNYCYKNRFEIW